jgi:hypothetical protein
MISLSNECFIISNKSISCISFSLLVLSALTLNILLLFNVSIAAELDVPTIPSIYNYDYPHSRLDQRWVPSLPISSVTPSIGACDHPYYHKDNDETGPKLHCAESGSTFVPLDKILQDAVRSIVEQVNQNIRILTNENTDLRQEAKDQITASLKALPAQLFSKEVQQTLITDIVARLQATLDARIDAMKQETEADIMAKVKEFLKTNPR